MLCSANQNSVTMTILHLPWSTGSTASSRVQSSHGPVLKTLAEVETIFPKNPTGNIQVGQLQGGGNFKLILIICVTHHGKTQHNGVMHRHFGGQVLKLVHSSHQPLFIKHQVICNSTTIIYFVYLFNVLHRPMSYSIAWHTLNNN